MAGWFDNAAKRSAQRAGTNIHIGRHAQISRRRMIVGGSAAAATAWTAPMLMASSAAAVTASACPAGSFVCGPDPATSVCCPNGQTCNPTGGLGGTPSCQNEIGGVCGNQGSGLCRVVHCNGNANVPNQCNDCSQSNICGGEGAVCFTNADCAQAPGITLVCSPANSTSGTTSYCRRTCTSDAGCSNAPLRVQFCDTSTGFCAQHCARDNQCQPSGNCVNPHPAGSPPPDNSICFYSSNV